MDLNQNGPSSSYLKIGEELAPEGFWNGHYDACGDDGNDGTAAGITSGGYVGQVYGPVAEESGACSASGGSVIEHVFLRPEYGAYVLFKADGTALEEGYYRVPERSDNGQGLGKGPANWGVAPANVEEALEVQVTIDWPYWSDADIFIVGSLNGIKADGMVVRTGGPTADGETISMYIPGDSAAETLRIYAVTFKDNDVTTKPTHYGNTGEVEVVLFQDLIEGTAPELTIDFGTDGTVPSPPFAILPKPAEGSDNLTYTIAPNTKMDPW